MNYIQNGARHKELNINLILYNDECINEEIMSFLLCFISSLAGNAVLVLQFFLLAFYWFVESQSGHYDL